MDFSIASECLPDAGGCYPTMISTGWDEGSLPFCRELETSWLFMRTHSRSTVCSRLVIKYNRLLKSTLRLQLTIVFPNRHTADTFYLFCRVKDLRSTECPKLKANESNSVL